MVTWAGARPSGKAADAEAAQFRQLLFQYIAWGNWVSGLQSIVWLEVPVGSHATPGTWHPASLFHFIVLGLSFSGLLSAPCQK